MAVWLITWEPASRNVETAEDDRVVAILNYRWKAENVRKIVEILHANAEASLSQRLAHARMLKKGIAPAYHALFNGWEGQTMCGTNPFMYGRLVDNPRILEKDGRERLIWDERHLPENVRHAPWRETSHKR